MKAIIFLLLAVVFLTTGSVANATTSHNTVKEIQAAIHERIDGLQGEIKVARAAYRNASPQERFRLRKEIRTNKYRIQQLYSIKRVIPRLSKHQLKWIVHYLNLNVSVYSPSS